MVAKKAASKHPPKAASLTSPKVKALAGKGLRAPSTLTTAEVRELAGSVLEHIAKK